MFSLLCSFWEGEDCTASTISRSEGSLLVLVSSLLAAGRPLVRSTTAGSWANKRGSVGGGGEGPIASSNCQWGWIDWRLIGSFESQLWISSCQHGRPIVCMKILEHWAAGRCESRTFSNCFANRSSALGVTKLISSLNSGSALWTCRGRSRVLFRASL